MGIDSMRSNKLVFLKGGYVVVGQYVLKMRPILIEGVPSIEIRNRYNSHVTTITDITSVTKTTLQYLHRILDGDYTTITPCLICKSGNRVCTSCKKYDLWYKETYKKICKEIFRDEKRVRAYEMVSNDRRN